MRNAVLRTMASVVTRPKENVASYPRPPRLESANSHIQIFLDGTVVADTKNAYRVLEAHHPPNYYLPRQDCTPGLIHPNPSARSTLCEWKGNATYHDIVHPTSATVVTSRIWSYDSPTPAFQSISGYYSFYCSPFECYVDGERATPQPGSFYGGWVNSWIEGEIKGSPGTMFW